MYLPSLTAPHLNFRITYESSIEPQQLLGKIDKNPKGGKGRIHITRAKETLISVPHVNLYIRPALLLASKIYERITTQSYLTISLNIKSFKEKNDNKSRKG